MRIGILGGTFNPVHYGHLISANEAVERFRLEKVIFIPAARPPHKVQQRLIDAHHRLMMTLLATLSHPRMEVSAIELEREGKSYSIHTIEELKRSHPPETEFFFIGGCDAFMEVATWREVDRLFRACHFIVNARPGYPLKDLRGMLEETVTPLYRDLSFRDGGRDELTNCIQIVASGSPYVIYLAEAILIEISASDIRRRLAQGRTIRYLVPDIVEQYVRKHGLYGAGQDSL
ncbi:MAG: nicotinate-nucleotide adenylyltransferase [Nitrospinae bacterium]|nr:nicotinate-nucleotide adenylyltransferase [Nitrospinota bacterium]